MMNSVLQARFLPRLLALLAALACVAVLPAQNPGRAQNLGDVRPQFGKYEVTTIAICPFNVSAAAVEKETIPRIIRRDLELSGYFKMPADQRAVNTQNLKDTRGGGIDWKAWQDLGVEHYVMGKLSEKGNSYTAYLLMYETATGQLIINRQFTQPKSRLRFLAHQLADEIVLFTKGSPGIANTKLLFVSERVPGVKEAGIMDADGFNARQITNFGRLVVGPTWGANGTEAYFQSYHGNRANIYGMILKPDAAFNFQPGQSWTVAAHGGTNHSPDWNEKSRRIVMVMSKDGGSEIYSTLRDGTQMRRLTETRFTEGSPCWSPDGSKVAFTSNEGGGIQLFVMNADGSGRRRITKGSGWHDAVSWSPDGRRLAFVWRKSNEAHNDIYVCNADGTDYRRLTMNEGNNESPSWAPDGRHIAFQSDRGGSWQIFMTLDDGSAQKQLTNSGRNSQPDWGPLPPKD